MTNSERFIKFRDELEQTIHESGRQESRLIRLREVARDLPLDLAFATQVEGAFALQTDRAGKIVTDLRRFKELIDAIDAELEEMLPRCAMRLMPATLEKIDGDLQ